MKSPFAQLKLKIKQAIDHDLPVICGNEAVRLFKQNFQKEGFFGRPWQEVKRRQTRTVSVRTKSGVRTRTIPPAKGAAGSRRILTGDTGDLGRSIKMKPGTAEVTIYSDLTYSAVHNEGLHAGRGRGFKMPKRQFIGDSPELQRALKAKIEAYLKKIIQS